MVVIALGVVGVQILFTVVILFGLRRWPMHNDGGIKQPISLIIAARNEANNLLENIPSWLAQNHAEYEVLIALNGCTDESLNVVKQFSEESDRIHLVLVPEAYTSSGKKAALTYAISQAKYDNLVFTDADCVPSSPDWLSGFAQSFSSGNELIIGAGMFRETGSIVNALYRLDALLNACKYFSLGRLGWPYMAVGRSFGYTKRLFQRLNGFTSHTQVLSGDDDLLVNQARGNAKIGFLPVALTISDSPQTWSDWWQQRLRHLSASKHYAWPSLLWLGGYEVTAFLCSVGLIGFLAVGYAPMWSLFFVLYVVNMMLKVFTLQRMSSLMNYESNSYNLIFFEPLLALLNPLFSMASLIIKPTRWKRSK
ncbi:MAG: glycosyltransferase [Salibacteraceae bacterium]